MSRYFKGLIYKFLLMLLASYISFGLIDGNAFLWVIMVSITVTIIDMLVVDLFILQRFGNTAAIFLDAIMAALIAYLLSLLIVDFAISWIGVIVFIIIVAISEYILHGYLLRIDRED